MRPDDIRRMSMEERLQKLEELRKELIRLRGQAKMGGAVQNAGKIKEVRRAIARILTIIREEQLKEEKMKGER
ncbi:MAG: 50S ribosomal protein L29 [Euryarchaeota archaeon]|nr:50S ribosomal protein L29 [Euryarchaeota archaeon]